MIKYLIFDTETTGLHIINDKPFLFQYGLVDENLILIHKEYFDATDTTALNKFIKYLKMVPTYIGHNLKFDLHMCINAGIDPKIFEGKNFIDTQVLARLVINHDKQTDASFRLGLKELAARYLNVNAADEEKKLKVELSRLTSEHKQELKEYLLQHGVIMDSGMKMLNEIYNTWEKNYHKYSLEVKNLRNEYFKLYPAPTYADVSNVKTYGLTDIILTHGLFQLWYKDVVRYRQEPTLKRTSEATLPLLYMERAGVVLDIRQISLDRNAIIKEMQANVLIDPRNGNNVTTGQHAVLKEIYEYETGMRLNNSDKKTRASILHNSPTAQKVDYLAKLAKYLNTYITGMLKKVTVVDNEYRAYTQYNIAGTITGRLSSDFQQFPKEPLTLNNGHVVNIRSWFVIPEDSKYMFYFDYSQLELKLQCEWTNIVNGEPDLNLARAFGPYKCVEINGKHYLEEDTSIEWKPTDLHGLTAKHAFPGIDESHPDWSHYRSLGKRGNFAINYGASAPKLQEALNVSFTEAQALVEGYKKTFKGVVDFSKWIKRRVWVTQDIPNLFLRRYYSRNAHQLQNWLVQGSGADLLLEKLALLYKYLQDKPHWQLMITVHDEVGLTCQDIDPAVLNQEVQDIQQILFHQLTAVEVTADVEYTTTNWAKKEDWK